MVEKKLENEVETNLASSVLLPNDLLKEEELNNNCSEDLSVILITDGLPSDISEREFGALFTFVEGFEGSEVHKSVSNSTIGLARFCNKQIALKVQLKLSSIRPFGEKLKIDLAEENLNLPLITSKLFSPLNYQKRESSSRFTTNLNVQNSLANSFIPSNTDKIWSTPTSPHLYYNAESLDRKDGFNSFASLDKLNQRTTSYFKSLHQSSRPSLDSSSSIFYNSNSNDYTSQNSNKLFHNSSPNTSSTNLLNFQSPEISKLREFLPIINTNPADQNPPCNTIYVGNLPISTSEEELRAIFSMQKGYRRLCFRTKPNGPMCFVEFMDIEHASLAMNHLQGYLLRTSIKGGIRLSYSKNPLGVRNPQAANNTSNKQQSNVSMSYFKSYGTDIKPLPAEAKSFSADYRPFPTDVKSFGAVGSGNHKFYHSESLKPFGHQFNHGPIISKT